MLVINMAVPLRADFQIYLIVTALADESTQLIPIATVVAKRKVIEVHQDVDYSSRTLRFDLLLRHPEVRRQLTQEARTELLVATTVLVLA